MKKLTLVNVSKGFEKGIMPLGLISIATYLRKYGNCKDIILLDSNCQDIYKEFKATDIVGISAVTQDINRAIHFARFVKKKYDIPVILGGVHVSSYRKLPGTYFDLGVIGEGEQTMLELMRLDKFSTGNLRNINGICFNDSGEIIFTPSRELIDPLDKIPIPDRDIVNLNFYLKKRQIIPYYKGRSLTIMTSRGCPFSCSFCSTKIHWDRYRIFSAERVIEEIELLSEKYKAEIIHIFDDLFIADKVRLMKIYSMLLHKGLNKKIKFMCLARSDLLDDQTMKILKEMNVVITGIGMESGCERILDYLKNHTTTIQKNRQAIELSNKYKIPAMGSFMIGNPYENEQELFETLDFIKSYRISSFLVPLIYISTPFPGTKFWDFAQAKGLPLDRPDDFTMDIPNNIEKLRKAPLLTDIPLEKFFKITQLFMKENHYGTIKKYLFHSAGFFNLLKAYIHAILVEKNIFRGLSEVNKMRKNFLTFR